MFKDLLFFTGGIKRGDFQPTAPSPVHAVDEFPLDTIWVFSKPDLVT